MQRDQITPRENWKERCEEVGFNFHSMGGRYWIEDAVYKFTLQQIDQIEDATNNLHAMSMDYVADIIKRGDYARYKFDQRVITLIEESWRFKEPHLYGRFDFGYDGRSLKMFEYNADTPTSLLEAAVVQWNFIEEHGLPDQFNSIHEALIERWKFVKQHLPVATDVLYFASMDTDEDVANCHYLMDTAVQSGFDRVSWIDIQEVELLDDGSFADTQGNRIVAAFKLYPWEWMIREAGGETYNTSKGKFIEPAWKMLLSNKHLLAALWEKHRGHPNLLEASETQLFGAYVKKPALAREGMNVEVVNFGQVEAQTEKQELYDTDYIYQERFNLPVFRAADLKERYPVIGSWVVGDKAVGIGIREDATPITSNGSHFVPHYFVE